MNAPTIDVFLDPGHGGSDSGAVAHGIIEKWWVYWFANALYWTLHGSHWIRPHISRGGDKNLSLVEAAYLAHLVNAKLALCVHVNANDSPNPRGLMAFAMPGDATGLRIANVIQAHAPEPLARRTRSATLAMDSAWPRVCNVLRPYQVRKIPAVLVEVGFCTNEKDALLLDTPMVRASLLSTILLALDDLRNIFAD